MKLDKVPVLSIDPGRRGRKEYGDLKELKESIQTRGLLHPIAVVHKDDCSEETLENLEPTDDKCPYITVAGDRRRQAMLELYREKGNQFHTIDVKILDGKNAHQIRAAELEENLIRKDLTWQEETDMRNEVHALYQEIYGEKIAKTPDAKGHSMTDTAEKLGVSKMTISRDTQLAKAMEEIPELREMKSKKEALSFLKRLRQVTSADIRAKELEDQRAKTPLDIQRKKLIDHYLLRNFFDFAKTQEDSSVDFMEADPPWAFDYDVNRHAEDKGDMYKADWTPEEYRERMPQLFNEAYRILRPNSWFIVWYAIDPWHEFLFKEAFKAGFEGKKNPALWTKPKGQSRRPDWNLGSSFEAFAVFRKGRPTLMKPGRSNLFDFNRVPPQKKISPNDKPIELYEEIIRTFAHPKARLQSCFLGGGNFLKAGNNLGHDVFGTDLEKKYRDQFIVSVNNGKPGEFKTFNNEVKE